MPPTLGFADIAINLFKINTISDLNLPKESHFTDQLTHLELTFYQHDKELYKLITNNNKFNLRDHENGEYRGCTIVKHVAKNLSYLQNKVKKIKLKYPSRDRATFSSYTDIKTAEECILQILTKNSTKIMKWYQDPNARDIQRFDFNIDQQIGVGLKNGDDTILKPRTKARVVLVKFKDKLRIKNSYPIE